MKKINKIYLDKQQEDVTIFGWIKSIRGNKKIMFINLNDGSNFQGIQLVVKGNLIEKIENLRVGSVLGVEGSVKLTPEAKQPLEVVVSGVLMTKNVDEDYPIQRQEMSLEVLREIPHLRVQTNLFRAVMRVRSTLQQQIHLFFGKNDFVNVASPIITGNDGEGAGEAFVVDSEDGDFFGKKATLGVTGQLQAESYANGFGDVYTFAPTFRAENSHTQKHAAEFWMVEPEMAFRSKDDAIKIADDMLRFVIGETMKLNKIEFEFLDTLSPGLVEKLNAFLSSGLKKITYEEAIEVLKENKDLFEFNNIEFGLDLATEHERFISEKHIGGPVAVTDFPKEIKAFYMKQNDDGRTVAAFDILVPGIGELVGGSERECDYDKLVTRVKEMNIPKGDIQWYLDLRRFGEAKSSGFGLGFERLVMYVTGVENIRDSIPFPRTPKNMKM